MTAWPKMVQVYEIVNSESEAVEILSFLSTQVDFVCARVLPPHAAKPGWKVQAFMDDCGHDLPLPDGCRRVVVPPSLLASCRSSPAARGLDL